MKRLLWLVLILILSGSACDEESPQCTACWDSYVEFYTNDTHSNDDQMTEYCEGSTTDNSCVWLCESSWGLSELASWERFDTYLSDTCDKVCSKD